MSGAQAPENEVVLLEPASEANVDLLVRWTLDPVAQGPYKRVPESSAHRLREMFLREPSREYFLVRMLPDSIPVGHLPSQRARQSGAQVGHSVRLWQLGREDQT